MGLRSFASNEPEGDDPGIKAALDHNCETVRNIDAEVRAIDADFHDAVFLRKRGIAACLTTPGAP